MKYLKNVFLLTAQLSALVAFSQQKLDNYIKQGLVNNETIRQQEFLLNKSLYALQEAKSLFLPNVSFNAAYTLSGGGRTVDIPVGDLVNPVYKTLNQLTNSSNFPRVENQRVLLNPNNFYDVKLHTVYPVINAEIAYNRKIKTQQYGLQKTEITIYKRELAKEIKVAYYTCLQATEAIKVYENALLLVKENVRINTALFNNQKVNRTVVVRSENEVIKITAQLNSAKQNEANANAYLNFLLNRPLSADIETDSIHHIPSTDIVNDTAVNKREELLKLAAAGDLDKTLVGLANTYKLPKLNSFLDVGSQAFDFNVNNKTPYYFFGLSLEWNIFSGGKNKYRVKQAEADLKVIQSQTSNVEQQLQLQVKVAVNSFNTAVINYQAAVSQVAASEKYYKDLLRLYKEGTALFIELLDAQNQLIAARLQVNISLFDTWIKQAEIERANAGLTVQ